MTAIRHHTSYCCSVVLNYVHGNGVGFVVVVWVLFVWLVGFLFFAFVFVFAFLA